MKLVYNMLIAWLSVITLFTKDKSSMYVKNKIQIILLIKDWLQWTITRVIGMVMEYNIGQIMHVTKEIGKWIKHMVKEYFGTQVVIFIKVNLQMICLTDMEFTITLMEMSILVISKTIFNMGKEKKNG